MKRRREIIVSKEVMRSKLLIYIYICNYIILLPCDKGRKGKARKAQSKVLYKVQDKANAILTRNHV